MSKENKKDLSVFQQRIYNSLENLVANLNTEKDKASHSSYKNLHLTDAYLRTIYKNNWVFGQVVDVVAKDMVREWRTLNVPSLSAKDMFRLTAMEKSLGYRKHFKTAAKWARLFGGSAIVVSIDGTGSMAEPLIYDRIKPGSVKWLKVFDKTDIHPMGSIVMNPFSKDFLQPEYYTLKSSIEKVHHSRVFKFQGVELPNEDFIQNNYWHDSALKRVYQATLNSDVVQQAAASLVFESKIDVLSIEGLKDLIGKRIGRSLLVKRFRLANQLKSINNMLLLDSKEKFERKTYSFTGLPDLMLKFMNFVAGAADIPATKLLGHSPLGLNATGEGDEKNYNSRVHGDQDDMFVPVLDELDKVLAHNTLGTYPDDWTYKFNSLDNPTKSQQADIDLKNSQSYMNLATIGLPASIIFERLMELGTFPGLTLDVLEALQKAELEDNPLDNDELDEEDEREGNDDTE